MTRFLTDLRPLLAFDAASCVLFGLLLVGPTDLLSGWTGLPVILLRMAGLVLFPVAVLMAVAALRPVPPRALVTLIILGNAGWVAAGLCLLVLLPTTAFGVIFILAQAAFVAGLTLLEIRAAAVSAPVRGQAQ